MSTNQTFSSGTRAWGICMKCGLREFLNDLREDEQYPELLVCSECWDEKHPQERLLPVPDPTALYRASPDDWGMTAPVLTLTAQGPNVLNWTASRSGAQVIVSYTVYRRVQGTTDFTSIAVLPVTQSKATFRLIVPATYTDGTADNNTLYDYKVMASDAGGHTTDSNIVATIHIVPVITLLNHNFWVRGSPGTGNQEPRIVWNLQGGSLSTPGRLVAYIQPTYTSTMYVDGGAVTTSWVATGEWWGAPGNPVAGAYQVRVTRGIPTIDLNNGMTWAGGPYETWITMNGLPFEFIFNPQPFLFNSSGRYQNTFTVQIRDTDTQTIQASAVWTLDIATTAPP
jgi:hypothetical protein